MRRFAFALASAILVLPLGAGAADRTAWAMLESLRAGLAAEGRLSADFTQVYTPAGFSTGEIATGRLALSLPDCLRWDYFSPDTKSFLLCSQDAYAWTEGDIEGRHQRVEARDEPGLDLLLLPMDHLRQRYDATIKSTSAGATIILVPRSDPATKKNASPLQATIELDPTGKRLLSLSYFDRDNNRTQFTIAGYKPISDRKLFLPPEALRWHED
ncbi:MAG: outer membrane lipoprotein carrier protein LolA [Acidobacteriota bacterium]